MPYSIDSIQKLLYPIFQSYNIKKAVLAGGVSANSMLREEMTKMCKKNGIELFIPPLELCTDNAAMIACQGYYEYLSGKTGDMHLNGIASLDISK